MSDQMDRYARGELTATEARELAQRSLEDPELFEELTAVGLANAAVSNRRAMQVRRVPRFAIAAAIAACVVASISTYQVVLKRQAPQTAPTILAMAPPAAEVSRDGGSTARAPRETGSVVSIENGEAAIDLGSIDGLSKGSELGPLTVTAVFRDHARASVAGTVRKGDAVQVPPAARFDALLLQGDAKSALAWAQRHDLLDHAEKRLAENQDAAAMNDLGVIAEMRGNPQLAVLRYSAALAVAKTADERRAIETNLARLRAAR